MSQENAEIVRRAYELMNDSLEILPRELFDPDYEFDARDVVPSYGVIRGYETVQAALLEYWQTFENFSHELKEVVHADEERVVTAVRDGGRIKGSDAEIWNDLFHVWTFRDGKIIRVSSHNEKNRALEAAAVRVALVLPYRAHLSSWLKARARYCAGDVGGERGGASPGL